MLFITNSGALLYGVFKRLTERISSVARPDCGRGMAKYTHKEIDEERE